MRLNVLLTDSMDCGKLLMKQKHCQFYLLSVVADLFAFNKHIIDQMVPFPLIILDFIWGLLSMKIKMNNGMAG